MMNPNPSALVACSGSSFTKLIADFLFYAGSVPPWTDREEGVAERKAITIPRDADAVRFTNPASDFLASVAAFV
jgi:hypothetical protein